MEKYEGYNLRLRDALVGVQFLFVAFGALVLRMGGERRVADLGYEGVLLEPAGELGGVRPDALHSQGERAH